MGHLFPVRIALADDHRLLRAGLASLIDSFENCSVIFQASNGEEVMAAILEDKVPDLLLLDLNMPGLDGYQTAVWLRDHYPEVRVLMLTMYEADAALVRLLQAGVKGFLKKDIHPDELRTAIHAVMQSDYYASDGLTRKLINLVRVSTDEVALKKKVLNEAEIRFLQMACTDMTYKEIAQQLNMSPRSIDTLRDQLFTRLDAQSRVGLALYAIRNGLVTI